MKKRLVIFASGNGTNTQNIIQHFQHSEVAEVVKVLTNNKNAKVLERAKALNVDASHFSKEELIDPNGVIKQLVECEPDLIILAGFLLKFPDVILNVFKNKVINIHPALLPKYGGKGMYGRHVHEAVVNNQETETGITIHYVNEEYDEGAIIFQKEVALTEDDTPEGAAKKVHELEIEYFHRVIEDLLLSEEKTKFS